MLRKIFTRMSQFERIITRQDSLNRYSLLRIKLFNFCKKGDKTNKSYANSNFFDELDKLGINSIPDKNKSIISDSKNHKIKGLIKEEKEKRTEILKREFMNNPEFLKAFPHLEDVIRMKLNIPNDVKIEEYLKKNTRTNESDNPYFEKSTNYFESLLNKYTDYELKTQEEKEIQKNDIFLDGIKDPQGPIKLMSRAEKERIHDEIDIRMQELEDSGLSKEEILFNKPEGIPLKYDKFFQYLKDNRIARELLIKPNEKFSADTILEKALKQNIGPDANMGLDKRRIELPENLPRTQIVEEYNRMFDKKKRFQMLSNDDFDYKENYIKKLKLFENYHKERPATFVNPPLLRSQLRKKYMIRTIKKKDVTWKNLPFLVKFLNEAGKLMNKYQSRLPTSIHRRLARSVKHARHLGLLPYVDYIRGFDKIPLTSTYNDFVDDISTVIDKKTGVIKHIHQPSLQDKFTYSNFDNSTEALKAQNERILAEKFKNSLKIDKQEIPFVPDYDQRELLRAHNYNIKLRQGLVEENNRDKFPEHNEKTAFDRVNETIKESFVGENLIDFYLSEKSYNYSSIKKSQKYLVDIKNDTELTELKESSNSNQLHKKKEQIKRVIEETLINNNLANESIKIIKEENKIESIKKKISVNNLEPKMVIKDPKRNNYRRFKN